MNAQAALIAIYCLLGVLVLVNLYAFFFSKKQLQSSPKGTKPRNSPVTADKSILGFAYDAAQDIFYTTLDAWQRTFGYCRLYDMLAPISCMVIHCEPIYFEYENKRWLIEFWKGQYGATCGCEVGIYSTTHPSQLLPDGFDYTLYDSTSELMQVSVLLLKNGKEFFYRNDLHWWLTGFQLGGYCEAKDFTARIKIRMKSKEMAGAFVKSLQKTGYTDKEFYTRNNDVTVTFSSPHTRQPALSKGPVAWLVLKYDKWLSGKVSALVNEFESSLDALQYIKETQPLLYKRLNGAIHPLRQYRKYPSRYAPHYREDT